MRALAAYIMRGRIPAAGITGLFGALGWKLPLFFLLSSAALGLVVLKHNTRTATQVLAGATLFCCLVAFVRFGTPTLALLNVLAIWLPVLICVEVLKSTRSQTMVLIVVMLMSILLAIGTRYFAGHGDIGNIEGFWQQSLTSYANRVSIVANADQQADVISALSVVMNGFVAVSFGMMIILSVLLARWWQSLLYNPGGFGEEFRKIQLPALIAVPIVISAILVALVKVPVPPYGWLLDILMIGSMVLMFHGLAVIHFFVRERQLVGSWLVGLYIFLVLASVYVFSLLAMLAIADSFSDFRKLRKA